MTLPVRVILVIFCGIAGAMVFVEPFTGVTVSATTKQVAESVKATMRIDKSFRIQTPCESIKTPYISKDYTNKI